MNELLIYIVLLTGLYAPKNQSPHGDRLKLDCAQCHTNKDWIVDRSQITFDHNTTNYILEGQHKIVDCRTCHTTLVFSEAKTECVDCHRDMHNQTVGSDCNRCHTPSSWIIENTRDLHLQGRFPLLGAHAVAECSGCHASASNLQFEALNIDCFACHSQNYQATTNPNHMQAGYSTNCLECHSEKAYDWTDANFNHDFFPLTGGHKIADCTLCHRNGQYEKISPLCNSCHLKDFNATLQPNHSNAGIPVDCETCHTITAWKPSSFNHITTGFELTGAHNTIIQCSDCHKGNLTSANQECISCHQEQYNVAPEHLASTFPKECTMCHTTNNWLETNFDHSTTHFPLTGSHITVDCGTCHTNGFAGTPTECVSCHQANFTGAQEPNHMNAGITNDCETCHGTTAWKPSTFDHITTGFELQGSHKQLVQCSDCHKGNLTSANRECISCHQSQYDNAPEHKSSSYPLNCLECHNQNNWLETNFDHNKTQFPLTGAHTTVDCAKCHTNGFAGTPKECVSCHQANFTSAQEPNHVNAGIPNDCETCHGTSAWKPSTFNHATTGFQLTGSHKNIVQCSDCHKGNLTSANQACISCHQAQYDIAPSHKASGYPTDCAMCHNSNNWLETSFDHSKTNFPLKGAHKVVECSGCHTNGFSGTSKLCYSCHSNDYSKTTNPNHAAANFPTDCESCHTETAWTPATFNHDSQYFPIYSGKHRGEWNNNCTTCHTNSGSYAVFSCINCHEHNKTSMDSEHRGRNGYSYTSSACYSCHPRGKAD